jgi:hypothetical protein
MNIGSPRTSLGASALAASVLAALLSASPGRAQVPVTTYHNDGSRSGVNSQETVLTPANVNSKQFGKLFTAKVDGYVYAQPLVLPNVSIGGGTHNALYVATEHDSVYGIDADTGTIYWQVNLIPAGGRTVVAGTDVAKGCADIVPEVGITGTPAIDAATNTLYVVAKAFVAGKAVQYLHALDTGTGAEKLGGPVAITASVAGTAYDSKNSIVAFQPLQELQRPGLLLEKGHIVIAWTSHCDTDPWHGWVMSYAAGTLAQEAVFNTSSNGKQGGIWMGGGGVAADASGNLFFSTGNGSWNGTTDFGDSVVKLGPPTGGAFPVLDYFTPYDQATLSATDNDLGGASPMLLPTTANGRQLLAQVSKLGTIYVLDRSNLGKYCVTATPACTDSDPQIPQEILGANNGVWGAPAYWNGNIYWGPAMGRVQSFAFNTATGAVGTVPTSVSSEYFNYPGPTPSISANGAADGIAWYVDAGAYKSTCTGGVNCAVLYANDATNLATMLYSSSQAPNARDAVGSAVKMVAPTIANGKVYVGAQYAVSAFGELAAGAPATAVPSLSPAPGSFSTAQSVTLSDTTPGAVIHYTTNGQAPTTSSTPYTGAIAVTATTPIQALAIAPGDTASAVAGGTYTINTTGQPQGVDLTTAFAASAIDAIDVDGTASVGGGVDGHGNALSGTLLGSSLSWSGAKFTFGPAGKPSGTSGTSLAIPVGNFASIELLAIGVNGNQPNATFTLDYTDGTSSTVTQSLSDWFTPQHYAGESIALTMAYRLTSTGAQHNGPLYLYGYTFPVPAGKTVKSLGLPNNRNIVVLALDVTPSGTVVAPTAAAPAVSPSAGTYGSTQTVSLSDATSGAVIYYTTNGSVPNASSPRYSAPITVAATTTIKAVAVASGYTTSPVTSATYTISASPVSVSLSAAANVVGIGVVGTATGDGGADGHGNAFAEALLGATLSWSGAVFKLGAADVLDAVSNAKLTLPAQRAASLALIATAVNGTQLAQKFVVTYSDGSTASFTQDISDWYKSSAYTGESVALSTAYRITPTGVTGPGPFILYGYQFKLDSTKTVASLTLPANRDVVVFAVDLMP